MKNKFMQFVKNKERVKNVDKTPANDCRKTGNNAGNCMAKSNSTRESFLEANQSDTS